MKQNNCILTHEVMISKHIVNMITEPSFLPGPKIFNYLEKKVIRLNMSYLVNNRIFIIYF